MISEHTVKVFDTDFAELTQLLAEMGGLVEGKSPRSSMRWRSVTSS